MRKNLRILVYFGLVAIMLSIMTSFLPVNVSFATATLTSAQGTSNSWYFAEGYTGGGFKEFLTIGNFTTNVAEINIVYYGESGVIKMQFLKVAPRARGTVYVNGVIGSGKNVSAVVIAPPGCVVERPMYFVYNGANVRGVSGGHNIVGTKSGSRTWYFAEGYTGTGFDTYYCILNPNSSTINVRVELITPYGQENIVRTVTVPARTRYTMHANAVVGNGKEIAAKLTSDYTFFVERPVYFNYNNAQKGGTTTIGATQTSNRWFFAEGNTKRPLSGTDKHTTDEYICVYNPNSTHITLGLWVYYPDAEPELYPQEYLGPGRGNVVQPYSRFTIPVHLLVPPNRDASIEISTLNKEPFVAERGMYFTTFVGKELGKGWITGGEMTMGSPRVSTFTRFAEGYTGIGFEEWLIMLNPTSSTQTVTVTFVIANASPVKRVYAIPPYRRLNVFVNSILGEGKENSIEVTASPNGIVVERTQYFKSNLSGDTMYEGGTINTPIDMQGA